MVRTMNGWPFMRPESGTAPGAFCARVAQNDGAGWLTTGRMNASAFMRPSLPQKPELEGAQCAPSSPVARLRMESMKARLMQWRLPEKPRPHCEPQSQSLPQSWVRNGPMKTCITPGNVSRNAESSGVPGTPLEPAGRGKKRAGMGMTPTPPQAGGEAARCRAQRLLAPTPPRESCAVRGRAVALLDTEPGVERQPGGRKGAMKFDEQSSGL